jgi:hypothetical protein
MKRNESRFPYSHHHHSCSGRSGHVRRHSNPRLLNSKSGIRGGTDKKKILNSGFIQESKLTTTSSTAFSSTASPQAVFSSNESNKVIRKRQYDFPSSFWLRNQPVLDVRLTPERFRHVPPHLDHDESGPGTAL